MTGTSPSTACNAWAHAACTAWPMGMGRPGNPRVLVCVHGLSRQGRDFDTFARPLSDRYRVVCPDVVGARPPDWLADPAGYQIPAYVADMVTLLARLDAQELHWVGTSMGGLIGLGSGGAAGLPGEELVLNDVGPVIELAALQRIGTYLGQPLRWGSVEGGRRLWTVSAGFGPHTREQWLALTRPMLARRRRLQAALRPGHRRALPRRHARGARSRRSACCGQLTHLRCRPCCCAARRATCSRARPRRR